MKSLKTLGAVALLSTSMLGAATSFAAEAGQEASPATATTPVKTKFKVADNGGENNKPENPGTDDKNPDGNRPLDPKGPFGIAYVPNRLFTENFETGETLNNSGSQEFAFKNSNVHVGVKDKTHTKGGWTLKAKLAWTGNPLNGAKILATTDNKVQINNSTSEGDTSYTPTTQVSTFPSLTINEADSAIMTGQNLSDSVYNGTYDVKLSDTKLLVPDVSQVEVGEYNGNVTWTLTASPLY